MNDITPVEILMLDYVGGGIRQDMKFPGYWQYQYGVDAQEVIAGLLEKNFLQIADTGVSLQHMEVKELKEILSNVGLKVSGRKSDLVERILGIDKQSLLTMGLPAYFIRTDRGNKILVENARPDMREYFEAVMVYGDKNNALKVVNAIEKRDFNAAEKNIPDVQKYDKDIFDSFLNFRIKSLGRYAEYETKIKLCVIYSFMAGKNRSNLAKYLMDELYVKDIPEDVFMRVHKYLTGIKSFLEVKKFAETFPKSKYTIYTMKDERTCKVCKKREGKSFPVSKAELGVSFPPFDDCTCEYCRCYASISIK